MIVSFLKWKYPYLMDGIFIEMYPCVISIEGTNNWRNNHSRAH